MLHMQSAEMTQINLYESYVEKLVKCLPMDDAHFITKLCSHHLLPGDTENKIKAFNTESDKSLYFLNHVIKPALDIDDVCGFKKLLLVMQSCGYEHVQKLSYQIENDISKLQENNTSVTSLITAVSDKTNQMIYSQMLSSRSYKEKFSEIDVEASFKYLLSKLEALWSEVDFSELRKICTRDSRLSNELRSNLEKASDLEKTLDLLAISPFCSWLELRILKHMAKVADVPEATHIIKVFEECIHNRKCSEVKNYFIKEYINPDHLTLVKAKLNKNACSLTVSDLIEYCHELESICKLPKNSSTLVASEEGCLNISFVIPTYCSLYAYEIAKNNFFKLRPFHIQYLQIGKFPKIYTMESQKTSTDNSFLRLISSDN